MRVTTRALTFVIMLVSTATLLLINFPTPSTAGTPSAQNQNTTPSPKSTPRPRRAPKIEMVLVPGGTFLMGSPESEVGRSKDEGPQHRVTVPSFYIGKYEVTQAQWRMVMGTDPSQFKGDDRPVENVSWDEATEFCRRLSRLTGKTYRLPSEAEWEYTARAGTQTPYAFGPRLLPSHANCAGSGSAPQSTRVGAFRPNAFGLYDMHGNVWEWCEDNFHEGYIGAPTDGSAWLSDETPEHVVRGGASSSPAIFCRSSYRDKELPGTSRQGLGLRVVTATAP